MNQLFIFCALVLSLSCTAQVKTVKKKRLHGPGCYESYFVLKSDKSIKEGLYMKMVDNRLAIAGYYKNNIKIGTWIYYDSDGSVYLKYNYDESRVIDFKPDISSQTIILNNDTIKAQVDRPPLYFGSKLDVLNTIAHNLHYPEIAQENNISGTVTVGIEIDQNGLPSNYFIVNGPDESLNLEAIRVVQLATQKWLPAIYQGEAVKSIFIQKVVFNIY